MCFTLIDTVEKLRIQRIQTQHISYFIQTQNQITEIIETKFRLTHKTRALNGYTHLYRNVTLLCTKISLESIESKLNG